MDGRLERLTADRRLLCTSIRRRRDGDGRLTASHRPLSERRIVCLSVRPAKSGAILFIKEKKWKGLREAILYRKPLTVTQEVK